MTTPVPPFGGAKAAGGASGQRYILTGALVLLAACAVPACAPRLHTVPGEEVGRAQEVAFGTVLSVNPIRIELNSGIGLGTGAAMGAIAGSKANGNERRVIATILGGLAGGVAGYAAESRLRSSTGVEVTVRLDGGRVIAVVQEDVSERLSTGDRVRVVYRGMTVRVGR
jgi:outer membrane lipoprotein SlyB